MKIIKSITLLFSLVFVGTLLLSGCSIGKSTYYVRIAPEGLGINAKPTFKKMNSYAEAKAYADENKLYGSVVLKNKKEIVYAPCREMGSEILYQAKIVCDFIRDDGFVYGNAPINPAFDYEAHLVSCDRLVDWILYRVGFTDQPYEGGKCVAGPGLTNWCIDNGFTKISNLEDLEPGDVVFVRADANGNPQHTFINAGYGSAGLYYRYDAGSDTRIKSTQPSIEGIFDFMYAYRAPLIESGTIASKPPISTFDPNVKYDTVLRSDFESGEENLWTSLNHISGLSTIFGALKFSSTGNDPQLTYKGSLGMDCSEIDTIRIRMKNGTYSDTLQIFYTTDTIPDFTEDAVLTVNLERMKMSLDNDEWLEVLIKTASSKNWKGKLTGIRLDPVCGKGDVRIDYISFDKSVQ